MNSVALLQLRVSNLSIEVGAQPFQTPDAFVVLFHGLTVGVDSATAPEYTQARQLQPGQGVGHHSIASLV